MLKLSLRIAAVVGLLSLELYAVYAVLHPRVSPEYRAYYIDRVTDDWNPPHYAATPESGIVFGKEGWPDFVRSSVGFSHREDWGRWTDSGLQRTPALRMTREFSGPLCIQLTAHPSLAEQGR